jgi:hypothetical protein
MNQRLCIIIICSKTTGGALFSSQKILQNFSDSPSHRIFGHMHEALNIDKKIKLITQFRRNGRDESFKPN